MSLLDDLIIEADLSDGDVEDLADRFAEMVGKQVVDIQDDCGCCDCDGSCDDDEVKFPCRITCSDEDEDPIDIELTLEALNVILDYSNAHDCSFNDAFCAILEEGLKLVKEELGLDDEDEDNDEDTEDSEDPFKL